MDNLYTLLMQAAMIVLGLCLFACLFRAVRGPSTSDRIVAVNMVGTQITIIIAILTFMMGEGYLADVALIYTMLSFLAVVLLTKVYLGVYREYHQKKQREETENA